MDPDQVLPPSYCFFHFAVQQTSLTDRRPPTESSGALPDCGFADEESLATKSVG